VPLTPETKNLINKETISKMKDGVIIIKRHEVLQMFHGF
jgi:phosphoglycerate dehydrogenase-like enzyme